MNSAYNIQLRSFMVQRKEIFLIDESIYMFNHLIANVLKRNLRDFCDSEISIKISADRRI